VLNTRQTRALTSAFVSRASGTRQSFLYRVLYLLSAALEQRGALLSAQHFAFDKDVVCGSAGTVSPCRRVPHAIHVHVPPQNDEAKACPTTFAWKLLQQHPEPKRVPIDMRNGTGTSLMQAWGSRWPYRVAVRLAS